MRAQFIQGGNSYKRIGLGKFNIDRLLDKFEEWMNENGIVIQQRPKFNGEMISILVEPHNYSKSDFIKKFFTDNGHNVNVVWTGYPPDDLYEITFINKDK